MINQDVMRAARVEIVARCPNVRVDDEGPVLRITRGVASVYCYVDHDGHRVGDDRVTASDSWLYDDSAGWPIEVTAIAHAFGVEVDGMARGEFSIDAYHNHIVASVERVLACVEAVHAIGRGYEIEAHELIARHSRPRAEVQL